MSRRRQQIAVGTVVVLVAALAGVGLWHYFNHSKGQIHDSAVVDAAKKVDSILAQFSYDHLYRADDYAHSVAQHPDVKVLAVTGETHWQTGVFLLLQVTGHGVERGPDGWVIDERDESICFRIQLGPHIDSRDDDIDCPTADPMPVAKDPSLAGVDARLKSALDSVGPNEAAVRAAIADLHLDPPGRRHPRRKGWRGPASFAVRLHPGPCHLGGRRTLAAVAHPTGPR